MITNRDKRRIVLIALILAVVSPAKASCFDLEEQSIKNSLMLNDFPSAAYVIADLARDYSLFNSSKRLQEDLYKDRIECFNFKNRNSESYLDIILKKAIDDTPLKKKPRFKFLIAQETINIKFANYFAEKLLSEAAEEGDDEAQYTLARRLLGTWGDQTINIKKATELLLGSANKGNTSAMWQLGVLYERGTGTLQDFKEALRWYKQASRLGDGYSMSELARMIEEGKGTPKNMIQAYMWYNLSVEKAAREKADDETIRMITNNRNRLLGKMSQASVEEAQNLSRQCLASNYQKCDF